MKPRTPGLWLIAAIISLLMPSLAFAGMTPEEVKAFEGYKAKAEKGDRVAQGSLGVCYAKGKGVAKDEVEAVKWYRKAADQGADYAQFELGRCYLNGEGVAEDLAEAVKWLRKDSATPEEVKVFNENKAKAERGDRAAQYNLGNAYAYGRGVAKDEVEEVKWLRKAADQGHAYAQYYLARCYRIGHGVAKDEGEAFAYFSLAGITYEDALKSLAILEKGMSPDARLRGQQRTKELQKSIEAKIAAKKAEDEKKSGK